MSLEDDCVRSVYTRLTSVGGSVHSPFTRVSDIGSSIASGYAAPVAGELLKDGTIPDGRGTPRDLCRGEHVVGFCPTDKA